MGPRARPFQAGVDVSTNLHRQGLNAVGSGATHAVQQTAIHECRSVQAYATRLNLTIRDSPTAKPFVPLADTCEGGSPALCVGVRIYAV